MISFGGILFLSSTSAHALDFSGGQYRVKKSGEKVRASSTEIKAQEPATVPPVPSEKTQGGLLGNLLNLNSGSPPKPSPSGPANASLPVAVPEPVFQIENSPQLPEQAPEPAKPFVNHEVFSQILEKYVTKSGWFDYRALLKEKEDRATLHAYVVDLAALNPSALEDLRDKLASWLNLYNAIVLDEILNVYPIEHMMKVPNFFAVVKFQIGDKKYSLMGIEEEIFQQEIHDPRTVFARVNGASSGPRFLKGAFDPRKIDEQLEDRTWKFLLDSSNVRYDPKRITLYLNPIFLWYEKEIIDIDAFLHNYLNLLPQYYQSAYVGFDWRLNDAKLH